MSKNISKLLSVKCNFILIRNKQALWGVNYNFFRKSL